jgi:hypothetical protein
MQVIEKQRPKVAALISAEAREIIFYIIGF